MRYKAKLKRLSSDDVQTLGQLEVKDSLNGEVVFFCHTLELAERNNEPNVSRIPNGKYEVVKRHSPKYKNHFIVRGVQGRSFILIHNGNFYYDTQGCILVGDNLEDINGDGHLDVTNSVSTLRRLFDAVDSFDLVVTSKPPKQ